MVATIISQVTTRIVRMPLLEPFVISTQRLTHCEHIIVTLETEDGLTGSGSVSTIPAFMGETAETVRQAIDYLGQELCGFDPFDIEAIHACMDARLYANGSAKAALDFACHDLMGKAVDQPVYRLIGGKVRDRVPCTWVIGIKDAGRTLEEAMVRYQQGYRVFKIKTGHDDRDDLEKLRLLRENLGPDAILRVDANTAYTIDRAIRVLPRFERYDLEMIEQPCKGSDLAGMTHLRKVLHTPLLADESAMSLEDVHRVIDARAADIINIKLGKVGGIHKARQIAAVARAAGLPLVIGSNMELGPGIAASAHFATATGNIPYACDLFAGALLHRHDLVDDVWDRHGMTMRTPYGPGLGVSLRLPQT